MVTAKEQEARDRFANRYREERVDVVRAIERRVIGGDWGANGYTTIEQADDLAHRLQLSRGDLLRALTRPPRASIEARVRTSRRTRRTARRGRVRHADKRNGTCKCKRSMTGCSGDRWQSVTAPHRDETR